mgnify:FL=1
MDAPKNCPLAPAARMWSTLDGERWCHGDVVESDACKACPLYIDHVMRMREAVWAYLQDRRRAS